MNRPLPEDIFLKEIKALIRNLLIDNPNYKGKYYYEGKADLMTDTIERAKYILTRIEEIEHLVKDFPPVSTP